MNYMILLSLIVMGLCETDITLLNCPSGYKSSKSSLAISSDSSVRTMFYSGLDSERSRSRTYKIIQSGDTNDLQAYMKQLGIPYIIFGLVLIGLYLATICCFLFDTTCPPCPSINRNRMTHPYKKSQLRRTCVIMIIIPLLMVAIIGYSLGVLPTMKENMTLTKCSIYVGIDTAINGDTSRNWGGFSYLKSQLGNISSLLSSASTQVSTYLPGDQWLVNDMISMKLKNVNIYNQYKNSRLNSPDPVAIANAVGTTPQIDSIFIKKILGPNGTSATMADDIDKGLRYTQILSAQAYRIVQSAKQMVQSSPVIQSNSINSQTSLAMYIAQFNAVNDWVNSFSSQAFNNSFSKGIYILQITFCIILIGSLVCLIGVISSHAFGMHECRLMSNLGWVLYGMCNLLLLVLLFVFLSGGNVGNQSCNYLQSILQSKASLDVLRDYSSQNVLNKYGTCLYGDGNALSIFSMASQMKTVSDLLSNIVQYYTYVNSSSSSYINKTNTSATMDTWRSTVGKYQLGITKDSYDYQTANSNPNYAISQLNLYSFQGGGVPTCTKDKWVFDKTNCTDTTQLTYIANATTQGTTINTSYVTCIAFNQKLLPTSNSSWSQTDLRQRYIQIRQGCPDAYSKIVQFGDALINYRDSRVSLFKAISQDLNSLYTSNINFNSFLDQFKGRVDQFYASISTLNNLMTNANNGLSKSSDCTVLKQNLQFTYNAFCGNFMNNSAKIGFCILALLFLSIGGTIFGCMFGMMYAQVDKDHQIRHLALQEGQSAEDGKQYNVTERSSQSD